MANKFQKSVIERLEQDAARKKHKAGNVLNGQAAPPPVSLPDIQGQPATTVLPDAKDALKPAVLPDIRDNPMPVNETGPSYTSAYRLDGEDIGGYLRHPQQRLAKNKTFYLDTDVIEAVKSVAKKQGLTESRLVNDILRHVLGV